MPSQQADEALLELRRVPGHNQCGTVDVAFDAIIADNAAVTTASGRPQTDVRIESRSIAC
jgi:hypothetical protein